MDGDKRWASLRDKWLGQTAKELTSDPRVAGWGLVGSFGRGEADDWSDVDLLVIVRDDSLRTFVDPRHNRLWRSAQLLVDARRNAPVGATSLATVYVESGLPIGADWYLYPTSMGAWPRDCDVRAGPAAAPRSTRSFAQWNGDGDRNEPIAITPAEQRSARLAMVPIAGKYLARRSPMADGVLQTLGLAASSDESRAQLQAVHRLVAELATEFPAALVAAISDYLSLVERALD